MNFDDMHTRITEIEKQIKYLYIGRFDFMYELIHLKVLEPTESKAILNCPMDPFLKMPVKFLPLNFMYAIDDILKNRQYVQDILDHLDATHNSAFLKCTESGICFEARSSVDGGITFEYCVDLHKVSFIEKVVFLVFYRTRSGSQVGYNYNVYIQDDKLTVYRGFIQDCIIKNSAFRMQTIDE